ncbi:lipase family protein [Gordonia sp. ABSL1-1]|uniref:alpha/beta hydrolase family protein n=1 Tax=Gordonia sp. ABSL1-1 TaxID=3053923 RepID=UPI0025725BD0|nr:lipase family protein [Gordonia sp. ABSL1-1]MDL9937687.1 lipase family protein [Gordonia sp. ABSL1-1]
MAMSIAVAIVGVGPANADDEVSTGVPNWSGLNVTDFHGPIPAKAGTLMARVPLASELNLPAAGDAYRIQFSTPNQHHRMATGTGAVFLPKGRAPKGGWPVISWAHGTVGMNDDCTPSAFPRSARDQAYLGHWIEQGYAVVAADYVGLGTPGLMSYLNGVAAAHSIVDVVVAAQQMDLPLAKKWAIIGQSQGAAAALNGARYATDFSRGTGLDYRGVVATGIPANLEYLYSTLGPVVPPVNLPGALNAYTAYILAGLDEARPELHLTSVLTAKGLHRLEQGRTTCFPALRDELTGDAVRTWFIRPLASIPGADVALRRYMATPYKGYDRPIFLGQGLRDVDVPAPSALSLYLQMRANNQPVELRVYPAEDHSGTVLASMPDSTPFLARIMR